MQKIFTLLCLLLIIEPQLIFAGHQNCSSARVVCNITDNPSEGQICNGGCNGNNNLVNGTNSCLTGGLTRWGFYIWTINQPGTLTISVNPQGGFFGTDDYNWAVFDISGGCGNLGNALRCSSANTNGNSTGLNLSATDTTEGAGGDGWCRYLDVQCGHTYAIVLDVPNNGGSGFDMSFGGTCTFGVPVNFAAAQQTVCTSQCNNFSLTCPASSTNPFIVYNWDFGANATPATYTGVTPPCVSWSTTGTKTVTLTAITNGSCTNTNSITVDVANAAPTSTFTVTSPACIGNPVTITYTGNGSTTGTYNWNFNGGTVLSGTGQGPYTVSWPSSGAFNVSLDVNDCGGQSATTTIPVNVVPSPTSTFTASSPVCAGSPSTIAYNGNAPANATYNWNFNGGTVLSGSGQGPYTVSWAGAGVMNVTLDVVDNGCTSPSTSVPVTVVALPVADAGPDVSFCSGSSAVIGAPATPGYIYLWNSATGLSSTTASNPTVQLTNTSGSNLVTDYIVDASENGCQSFDTVQVTVFPSPVADAGSDVSFCTGLNANIGSATVAGNTYAWSPATDLSDPTISNPVVTSTNAGSAVVTTTYTVTVTANNCSASDSVHVSVVPLPVAAFTLPAGQCLTTNNFSFTAGGSFIPSATFAWTFQNGSPPTSTQQNPTGVFFLSAGNNTITLTITQSGCASTTVSQDIIIYPAPVADFSADTMLGCESLTVNFTDTSTSTGNNINRWNWDFGDGNTGNTQNPVHMYSTPGVYTVTLTATTTDNCPDAVSYSQLIILKPNPIANFSADNDTVQLPDAVVNYTNQSFYSDTYLWNLGNGDTSQLFNASAFYHVPGKFTVTLYAYDTLGCTANVSRIITVLDLEEILVPTAFSPNGDGVNDLFRIINRNAYRIQMLVYNRWGELLFETENPREGWDGTYKGMAQDIGVYAYTINAFFRHKATETKNGTVTLVR